jgi:hypothetical protein
MCPAASTLLRIKIVVALLSLIRPYFLKKYHNKWNYVNPVAAVLVQGVQAHQDGFTEFFCSIALQN